MPRRKGSTVSGVVASGGLDYSIEVYRKAGGGAAGRRAVERYLQKTYPSAGKDTREAVQRRVTEAINIASRYQRGGDSYRHEEPRRGSSGGGVTGGGVRGGDGSGRTSARYTYNIEVEATVKNEEGRTEVKTHRVTIFSSTPLTNRQLHEQAQADYSAWVADLTDSDRQFQSRYEGTRIVTSRVIGVY